MMDDAYPHHLAAFVQSRWKEDAEPLPEPPVLEKFLSICYQASMLSEEDRMVTFRVMLCDPDTLPPHEGPPDGLHRLEFPEPRPFDMQELRRLSPATDYYRSLVGVKLDETGELRIWGIVHSGPRWLRADQGGRDRPPSLPLVLILHVTGPGHVSVSSGDASVGKLELGRLSGAYMDVFGSTWMPEMFAQVREELSRIHSESRVRAVHSGFTWAPLDNDIARVIGQHLLKRLIAAVRNSRHGGTIIIVPPDLADDLLEEGYVSLKYAFVNNEPRRRYRSLILRAMNTIAEIRGGEMDGETISEPVGWDDYEAITDEKLANIDEAIFEVSHLIAGLTAVDGAFVMTQRYELLGFGGEISGNLPDISIIEKALDTEGEKTVKETTTSVGTRHRSAYRLAGALPRALVVVVSQDGNVQFVKHKDGAVMYWDQA